MLLSSNAALIGGHSTKPGSSYYALTLIKARGSVSACGQWPNVRNVPTRPMAMRSWLKRQKSEFNHTDRTGHIHTGAHDIVHTDRTHSRDYHRDHNIYMKHTAQQAQHDHMSSRRKTIITSQKAHRIINGSARGVGDSAGVAETCDNPHYQRC